MAMQAKFDGPKPFQKKKGLVDKRGQNCGHCGKTGHTKEVCFGIYGYPDWYKSLMDQRKRNTTSTNRVLNATEEKESVQNAIEEQTISEIIRTNLQRLLRKETPELADSINENYEHFFSCYILQPPKIDSILAIGRLIGKLYVFDGLSFKTETIHK
ncbi:UNVERIFIED_CONTAM: hypothetical protein Sradi_6461900 [Sesamum radiatum]|uniref:CCHC-type domain-containing protein n=1 Tax=Sesamum radiatum TaxID=300843 RepID=A0AAW2K5E2_SESRA